MSLALVGSCIPGYIPIRNAKQFESYIICVVINTSDELVIT